MGNKQEGHDLWKDRFSPLRVNKDLFTIAEVSELLSS